MGKKKILKKTLVKGDCLIACDLVASKIDLSKEKIKKAMMNGSCWLKKGKIKGQRRIRKAKTPMREGDTIEFFYDPEVIFPSIEGFEVLTDNKHYGIWKKVPGMLSQGTKYGDAGSVLREIEKIKNQAFLIHRLDREVGGLIIVGYTHKAAVELSALFRSDKVGKYYRCWVKGIPKESEGLITEPLDEKESKTGYKILEEREGMSLLEVQLFTGRTHQIRRHLEFIGHPVIGDPRYGKKNKDDRGLQLASYHLEFKDPFTTKKVAITLEDLSEFLTI